MCANSFFSSSKKQTVFRPHFLIGSFVFVLVCFFNRQSFAASNEAVLAEAMSEQDPSLESKSNTSAKRSSRSWPPPYQPSKFVGFAPLAVTRAFYWYGGGYSISGEFSFDIPTSNVHLTLGPVFDYGFSGGAFGGLGVHDLRLGPSLRIGKIIKKSFFVYGNINPAFHMTTFRYRNLGGVFPDEADRVSAFGFDVGLTGGLILPVWSRLSVGTEIGPRFGALFGETWGRRSFMAWFTWKVFATWHF